MLEQVTISESRDIILEQFWDLDQRCQAITGELRNLLYSCVITPPCVDKKVSMYT